MNGRLLRLQGTVEVREFHCEFKVSSHLPEKDTCQNLGAHSVSFLLIISDSQVPLFVLETIVSQRPLHVHHRHMYPKEESYIIVQPILKWCYTLTYNNFHHSATCIYKKKKKKNRAPIWGSHICKILHCLFSIWTNLKLHVDFFIFAMLSNTN